MELLLRRKEETIMAEKNVYELLSSINVNDHTETKNGLTYLSWAWAWAEVKNLFPTATYKVYETAEGCIYWNDGRTAWVKTGVIIEGLEHIEYLPIMDHRNKSIPLDQITSFDVNKAIQRSLTKAVARHGLGLYIYAGEDLPNGEKKPLDEALVKECNELAIDLNTVASYFKKDFGDLTDDDLKKAIAMKRKRMVKPNA
jgi:hypothetical protein